MSENSIVKRMFGGTVAFAALAVGVVATLPAQPHDGPADQAVRTVAFRATEPCTPMEEPGQAGPDTGIHPPGSFEPAPVEPNGNAICHDIMP